jgi:uncharacterized protein YwgA
MVDEIRRLAAYMKELGVEVNVKSFASRIKLQKFAYILGVLLDDKLYDFEFYIRGPYSRPLAREYYENENLFSKDPGYKLSQKEKEVLDRIKPIAKDLTPTELEIMASLLYIEKKEGYKEDAAINALIGRKSYLKIEEIVYALNKLKQMMLSKEEEVRLLAILSKEMKPFENASASDLAQSDNS